MIYTELFLCISPLIHCRMTVQKVLCVTEAIHNHSSDHKRADCIKVAMAACFCLFDTIPWCFPVFAWILITFFFFFYFIDFRRTQNTCGRKFVPLDRPYQFKIWKFRPVRIVNSMPFYLRAGGLHIFAPFPFPSVISLTFQMETLKLLWAMDGGARMMHLIMWLDVWCRRGL